MWRGKDWKSKYSTPMPSLSKLQLSEGVLQSDVNSSGAVCLFYNTKQIILPHFNPAHRFSQNGKKKKRIC